MLRSNVLVVLALAAKKKGELGLTFDPMVWGILLLLVSPFLLYILVGVLMSTRKQRVAAAERALANKKEAAAYFDELSRGMGPIETSLILTAGEHALLSGSSVLCETRSYRRYAGAGTRIRGIHVGGGASDLQQALRKIDTGTLTLTNKRLVFDGSTENRVFKLSDILSVEQLADAIEVSTQRRQKSMLFALDNPLIWAPMLQAIASGKFSMRETENKGD